MRRLTLVLTIAFVWQFAAAEELIPRSMAEKAEYYLISVEKDGEYLKTVHRRTSSWGTGYSVTRIDCNSKTYMDLGYGDGSISNIKMYDDIRWTEIVKGSSKSDLVSYVCRKALT